MRSDAQTLHDDIDIANIGDKSWHSMLGINICRTIWMTLSSPISHSQPIDLHKMTKTRSQDERMRQVQFADTVQSIDITPYSEIFDKPLNNNALENMVSTSLSLDVRVHTPDLPRMRSQ